MKAGFTRVLATVMTVAALAAVPMAHAGKKAKDAAQTMVTVYISGHGGSAIAKKINAMHATMEAQGWRFADLEIHAENSDTEGAWVTYVK